MAVEKRDKVTCFVMTKTEKNLLTKICEEKNIRVSDYVRNLVLGKMKKDDK